LREEHAESENNYETFLCFLSWYLVCFKASRIMNTNILALLAVCTAITLTTPETSYGLDEPLATATLNGRGGSRIFANGIAISFAIQTEANLRSPAYYVFSNLQFTAADLGKTLLFTRYDSPEFDSAVGLLTNGIENLAIWRSRLVPHGGGGGRSRWESLFFNARPVEGNGIDLQGYTIGTIGFRLDHLSLDSPGTDPNGDGLWTSYDWSGTLFFYPAILVIPCDGVRPGEPWKSHGHYVSYVVKVVLDAVSEGLLGEAEAEVVIQAAAKSDCGKSKPPIYGP
jgi:hypothetical protein